MRILLVCLARRGGMVHFLAELANALGPICDTAVLRAAEAESSYFEGRVGQLQVSTGTSPPEHILRSVSPATWWDAYRKVREANPDIIHVTGAHPWHGPVALMAKLLGMPLVYTVHDAVPHPDAPWHLTLADWLLRRLSSEIVVLTRHARNQMVKAGFNAKRVRVIPHPMYTLFRRWRPMNARQKRVILYAGRIEPYKGLDVLINAFNGIKRSIPGWRLVIVGALATQLPPEPGNRVEVQIGYVPDHELARLAYSASIIALPYTSATQSGVIALAQAVGCPVVASNLPGLRETVIDGLTGLLVPPGDAAALGRALERLAASGPRRARMRLQIARIAAAKWNPPQVARAHMGLYGTLASRAAE